MPAKRGATLTQRDRDIALLRAAAMSVAKKDRVFQELYWMFLGAPPLTREGRRRALVMPDIAVPLPAAYFKRLIEASKVMEEPYRTARFRVVGEDGKVKRAPKTLQRPSRLAFLMWREMGPAQASWKEIASEWCELTEAWSTWLTKGKKGPVPREAERPQARFAFQEWLDKYGTMPATQYIGVECPDAEEVRRLVAKRAGPSLGRRK